MRRPRRRRKNPDTLCHIPAESIEWNVPEGTTSTERTFFMDPIQTPPRSENQRCTAISQLIEAVAGQQESLARILEAEHKKIEKTTQLYNTDVDDLLRIDDSVERILAAVTRLELAIQLKLDLFRDCLCPDAPCSGYQTACTK